jgi:hypothetical protein
MVGGFTMSTMDFSLDLLTRLFTNLKQEDENSACIRTLEQERSKGATWKKIFTAGMAEVREPMSKYAIRERCPYSG